MFELVSLRLVSRLYTSYTRNRGGGGGYENTWNENEI